ncbi:tyrosine--tRNA ligase [Candidatus Micrarchaeota archaeon]|nr:tyrosine--tRNA ligase [Candidatus Micrarchaeota archaeon]
MDVQSKVELATALPVEEIIQTDELTTLFETNKKPKHYIGFEISGLLHVGSLVANGLVINNLLKAGVECQVFLADWHSVINRKMDGDWDKIQQAAKYYEAAFKFFCPGVKIVHGSDLYRSNDEFWRKVLEFSNHVTMARATRCLTIMGRSEKETLHVSQFFYPSMQGVDIHELGADIAHAGMDQRKIHVLAREVYPKMGWKPPVCVHHHLLPALGEPPKTDDIEERVMLQKMSKSKPDSAVFIHDTDVEIKSKFKKAFCPEKTVADNPVLDWAKYLIFPSIGSLRIERPEKFGGDVWYESYGQLEVDFAAGKLHPMDLKNGVASHVNRVLEPVRTHFEKNPRFLDVYKDAKITR